MPYFLPPPLALQGLLDIFTNPATAWVIIPLLIFGIPIVQAMMQPFTVKVKADEREKMRKMYERITMEKLDVIKTAVAMGYQHSDLRELDTRLEEVIGSDAMRALLEGKAARAAGSAPLVEVHVGKSKKTAKEARQDLEELITTELEEGLRKREHEREAD